MKIKGQPSPKRRRMSSTVAIIAGAAIFVQASSAFAMICSSPAEQQALNMRVLQTKLMVSALSCNAKPQYNTFVKRFQRELVPHGKALRRLFHRIYGKKAGYHLDKFITRLANDESAVRTSAGDRYCPSAHALFTRVLNTHNGTVAALANTLPFAGSHGISSCQAKQDDFRAAQRRQ